MRSCWLVLLTLIATTATVDRGWANSQSATASDQLQCWPYPFRPPGIGNPSFSEGLAIIEVSHSYEQWGDNARYGYIDRAGSIVVAPRFSEAYQFKEGLALVKDGPQYGYIDSTGAMIIPPQFEDADNFSDGLALIRVGRKCGYIDKSGHITIPAQFDGASRFTDGLAAVAYADSWGYIDHAGTIVVNPQYDSASNFSEGLAYVGSRGRASGAYIDKTGRVVLANVGDSAYPCASEFHNGFATVGCGGSGTHYIDKSGAVIFADVGVCYCTPGTVWRPFSEGLAAVRVRGTGRPASGQDSYPGSDLWGFIDMAGSVTILPQFDFANDFSDGLAAIGYVATGRPGVSGFIDRTGKIVINPTYARTWSFAEGLAAVTTGTVMNSPVSYIDRAGQVVIPAR